MLPKNWLLKIAETWPPEPYHMDPTAFERGKVEDVSLRRERDQGLSEIFGNEPPQSKPQRNSEQLTDLVDAEDLLTHFLDELQKVNSELLQETGFDRRTVTFENRAGVGAMAVLLDKKQTKEFWLTAYIREGKNHKWNPVFDNKSIWAEAVGVVTSCASAIIKAIKAIPAAKPGTQPQASIPPIQYLTSVSQDLDAFMGQNGYTVQRSNSSNMIRLMFNSRHKNPDEVHIEIWFNLHSNLFSGSIEWNVGNGVPPLEKVWTSQTSTDLRDKALLYLGQIFMHPTNVPP